ncbi:MAG TPA: DUF1801 domain-containing protein [Candidatus Saccharimonadia bacterium]|jgi:hypothetical protein|nr:DUF1801 domain-containing protein [Candidatus Saccharimonadia bacterium]
MAELKTQVNDGDVTAFLNAADEKRRADGLVLLDLFKNITGEEPKMWGASIVGFGQYHYKSERSSQEGDWMLTGFSPRKAALTLYLMLGHGNYDGYLEKLGKHKKGGGCLYINKLADVDMGVLEELITASYKHMKETNGGFGKGHDGKS